MARIPVAVFPGTYTQVAWSVLISRLRRSARYGPEALLGVDPEHAREGTPWALSSNSSASPESGRALRPAYRPAEAPVPRIRHGNPGRRSRSKAKLDSPVCLPF